MTATGVAAFDYADTGAGPALVFLPGSYSTVAAWRPVQRLLRPGLRLVTTSLLGYGNSRDTRSPSDFGMLHEVALVEAVAARVGQPLHLVGHSFGGTVALAAALSRRIPVASLSLFEANPIDLIRRHDGGELHRLTLRMSRAFEAAVAAAEPDAAARIIDFWGGTGAFAAMPEPVRAYCRCAAAVNVLDWRGVFGWSLTPADCASLDLPVLLVRGERANEAMRAITAELARSLPRARCAVVASAGHFLISSHPADCAALVSGFLDEIS